MSIRRSFFIILTLAIFSPFSAIQAQDTQYGQGLFLDYYVMQNPDDIQEPTGRSLATLIDTSAPQLSYLGPFEIEPALEQFRDKLWGLHWSGFLKVNAGGAYSFNLQINTSSDDNNKYIICSSWLKVQDRQLVSHERQKFVDGNKNAYGDIDLRSGIYDLEVWFACSELEGRTVDRYKPQITLNMRGPDDAMLKPIPKNQLLHELN